MESDSSRDSKDSKNSKEDTEVEYTLSNDDIKFSTFFDPRIEYILKHEKMSKEILIQDLNILINELKYIIDTLSNISLEDKNNFNTLCLNYKINSYDYVIIINFIKELTTVILNKILKNNKPLELTLFDEYFQNKTKYSKLFLSQHKLNDTDFRIIGKKATEYIVDIKEVFDSDNECGILFMCHTIKYYLSFVIKVKEQLDQYIEIKDFNDKKNIKNYRMNMIVFFDLIFLLKKMESSNLILNNAYLFDKNDIFNYEQDSKEWEQMKKVMVRVHSKNDDKIQEEFINMAKKMENMGVYVNKAVNSNLLLSASKFTGLWTKFKMNSDKNLITYESKESLLLSNKNIIQEMIKLGRKKIVKVVYEKSYPKICFREKVYMKRNYPEINLNYIKSLLSKIYGEEIISKNFGRTTQKKRPELNEAKKEMLPLWAKKVNKEDKKYYVSTRILNSYPLKFKKIKEKYINKEEDEKIEDLTPKKQLSFEKDSASDDNNDTDDTDTKSKSQRKLPKIKLPSFNFKQIKVPSIKVPSIKVPTKFIKLFKNNNKKNDLTPNALMIYIHGGGFLNTSFFFHENYLRDICNKIKIPILGINYAGAPEHPYPEGINDCYQAYMWILDNCESEFGFKPEKIILAGDSSGGNFALCLNNLLMSMNLFEGKNIHTPDFLFPLYPCSNASRKNMSLSLASSFEDYKITIKGLREINESYRGYYPNELDPFINPRDAPDILLKNMPKVRFMTGSHDPLRDDSVRLIYKLCKVGADVKNYDFFNYQHGFIGVSNPIIKGPSRHIFVKEINEFLQQ
jgi:acetyl esterase/lipase